ncbi:MAG: hypothetical protein CM15mV33_320 [uncultured marine virus]|nr:MAG: hypothetical protein CM15mV33_320 [uncultured marine virus]
MDFSGWYSLGGEQVGSFETTYGNLMKVRFGHCVTTVKVLSHRGIWSGLYRRKLSLAVEPQNSPRLDSHAVAIPDLQSQIILGFIQITGSRSRPAPGPEMLKKLRPDRLVGVGFCLLTVD